MKLHCFNIFKIKFKLIVIFKTNSWNDDGNNNCVSHSLNLSVCHPLGQVASVASWSQDRSSGSPSIVHVADQETEMQNNFCEVSSCGKASHLYTLEVKPKEPELTGEKVSRDDGTQENLRGKNHGGTFTNQR